MNGLLLYNKYDYEKNRRFAGLLCEKGKAFDLSLSLCFTDEAETLSRIFKAGDPSKALDPGRQKEAAWPEGISFVINRSRNSLLARSFEDKGVRVFNSSKVSEILNDKDLTKRYLDMHLKEASAGGLPFMEYITCGPYNNERYEKARSFGYPLVAKPANGHGGSFVRLIRSERELENYLEELSVYQTDPEGFDPPGEPVSKLLFEAPASEPGKDLRIYVLGGRMIASVMRRGSSDIRANFSLGGKASLHELNEEERSIAASVIKALPSDLIGIDLIYHNGHPVFNEAEDAVGCRMLYQTADIDIAEEYMKYIASALSVASNVSERGGETSDYK